MTKISFQLTDDYKLPAVIAWLQSLKMAENIELESDTLTPKQRNMKKNLEESNI